MQFSSFTTGAAVLLALAPCALAAGKAHVVNNCDFPVYYASVFQNNGAAMKELPKDGFSDAFTLQNAGVSIKLATSPTEKPTQFEYTWANGKINYDISNIDGNPFLKYGMQLSPTLLNDAANPSCKNVTCAPGVSPCVQAYNLPNDVRTMVCSETSDLTMTLCPKLDAKSIAQALVPNIIKRHTHRSHPRQIKF